VITLRLIQRLSLLYGFEAHGHDQRVEMWKAAAAASGIDYGKDLAEKTDSRQARPAHRRTFRRKTRRRSSRKVGWAIDFPLASSAIAAR